MNDIDEAKLKDMLRKVQGLLAQADHPNTPVPEAKTFRDKAEALMYRYRIDEAAIVPGGGSAGELVPEWAEWRICNYGSEFLNHYHHIAQACARHLGLRLVFATTEVQEDERVQAWTSTYIANVCGYPSDLIIGEALYTSCAVAFQQKLEPTVDPSLSDQVNCYNLRSAGMEGWRIAQAVWGSDDRALRVKARKLFQKEAEARDEDPAVLRGQGNSVKTFREDYANGFSWEISGRLTAMRQSRGEDERGLVLFSRAENVNEFFYERYPHYRPASGTNKPYRDPREGCAKCAKAKSGYCRDHQWLKPSMARGKTRSTNMAAYRRGSDAAQGVDLGRGGTEKVGGGSGPAGELG